jgi:hypothetical protein
MHLEHCSDFSSPSCQTVLGPETIRGREFSYDLNHLSWRQLMMLESRHLRVVHKCFGSLFTCDGYWFLGASFFLIMHLCVGMYIYSRTTQHTSRRWWYMIGKDRRGDAHSRSLTKPELEIDSLYAEPDAKGEEVEGGQMECS